MKWGGICALTNAQGITQAASTGLRQILNIKNEKKRKTNFKIKCPNCNKYYQMTTGWGYYKCPKCGKHVKRVRQVWEPE